MSSANDCKNDQHQICLSMRLLNIFKSVIVLSKLEERDFETTKNTGQENLDKIIKLPKIVSFSS